MRMAIQPESFKSCIDFDLIEQIISIDQELFLLINGSSSPVLDYVMYWLSHKWVWIPLYAFILIKIYQEIGLKKTVVLMLSVAVLITMSDQLSVHLFKNQFERLRPCHDPLVKDQVILLNGKCGGRFGFLSSHASNTMALIAFLVIIFRDSWKYWCTPLICWSLLVGISRVYLGVHYPTDVLAGWVFGGGLGSLTAWAFLKSISQTTAG